MAEKKPLSLEAGVPTQLGSGDNIPAVNMPAPIKSIAQLTTAADKMIYATASDTYAVTDLTAFARTLLDDANAGAMRTTLGIAATDSVTFGPITSDTAVHTQRTTGDLDTTGISYFSLQDNSTGSYAERAWFGFGAGDGGFDVTNATAGQVHLRNSGGRKLSTTASGVEVTGTLGLSEHINFTGDSVGTATDRWQGSDGSGSTVYNVPTSKGHIFAVNNATVATILAGGLDFIGTITATTGVTVASGQDTLTHYIEDTYNPTLTCSTSGTVTLNTSFDTLSYTRIGNIVNVRGYIEVSSVSSPLGDLRLSLPIGSANPAELAGRSVAPVTVNGSVSKNAGDFGAFIDEGVSYASIALTDAGSLSFAGAPQMQASTSIFLNFNYQV